MKILSFDVGIINLAYCIFDSTLTKITKWEVITLNDHTSKGVVGQSHTSARVVCHERTSKGIKAFTDYNKIYINLINELDARKCMIEDIDVVLIEKQPSFNPKMRVIAGCLQTYFIIRGMVDLPENPIKSVKFFSPKHKLKCYTGPELVIDSKAKGKYARTKKLGVLICQCKLKEYNESPETIKLFNDSKKKDDLSDCYLQAITYSMFEKIIDYPDKVIKKKGSVKIPIGIKTSSKEEIKKQFKEYLTLTQDNGTSFNFNELPDTLKNAIKIKYLPEGIFDNESIKSLLGMMNMKKFIYLIE